MYIGKHRREEKEETGMQIPENYAGNAFREAPAPAPCEDEANVCEMPYLLPTPARAEDKKRENRILPQFDRLFSTDSLLILLAILLSGGEDGGDISLLLLLLLLF